MDLLSVIRRWHGRDQLSIREIARRTGLSRNTIRKYLANGEVQPKYPARKSVSKLDPYADYGQQLSGYVLVDVVVLHQQHVCAGQPFFDRCLVFQDGHLQLSRCSRRNALVSSAMVVKATTKLVEWESGERQMTMA